MKRRHMLRIARRRFAQVQFRELWRRACLVCLASPVQTRFFPEVPR